MVDRIRLWHDNLCSLTTPLEFPYSIGGINSIATILVIMQTIATMPV